MADVEGLCPFCGAEALARVRFTLPKDGFMEIKMLSRSESDDDLAYVGRPIPPFGSGKHYVLFVACLWCGRIQGEWPVDNPGEWERR
jgi:hypothetical protein